MTLSLDPGATRIQLLRGVAYLLAFLAALRVVARVESAFVLEMALAASGLIAAVAALLHPALGVEKVFGLYKPASFGFGSRVGPLLNTNHLAAYVNIAVCTSLAMGLSRAPRIPRSIPLAVFFMLAAIQVWIASRGGMVAMVFGIGLVVWMWRVAAHTRRTGPIGWAFLAGGVALVGVLLAVVASSDTSRADLASTDTTKIALIKRSLHVAKDFLWTGAGRGAFESVFPAYRNDHEGHVVFTHPENLIAQWVSEWGLPVAIIAFAGIAYALRPRSALTRSLVPIGPWAAIVTTGVHNLVDFNLEVPAIGIALAVSAACVVSGSAVKTPRGALFAWGKRPLVVTGVSATLAVAASILVFPGLSRELKDDQAHLRKLTTDAPRDRERFVTEARAAMLRHPAEPYLPFMGAVRAYQARDESILPWIGRTLERATVYGRAHLLLARALSQRNPGQARLEYRLAMEQDGQVFDTALNEGTLLVTDATSALELVPSTDTRLVLERLAERIRPRLPASAAVLDAELVKRFPDATGPVKADVMATLADLRAGEAAPWCALDRPACLRTARAQSAALLKAAPDACESHRIAAEIGILAGETDKALDELAGSVDHVTDRSACLRALVELAMQAESASRLATALDLLGRAGCGTEAQCVDDYLYIAGIHEARGNRRVAFAYVKKAYDRSPSRTDLLPRIGELATSLGLHGEAIAAYEKLSLVEPNDQRWPAALARSRSAMSSVPR
jgi:tetratricopeptide (TPR) repeat protein